MPPTDAPIADINQAAVERYGREALQSVSGPTHLGSLSVWSVKVFRGNEFYTHYVTLSEADNSIRFFEDFPQLARLLSDVNESPKPVLTVGLSPQSDLGWLVRLSYIALIAILVALMFGALVTAIEAVGDFLQSSKTAVLWSSIFTKSMSVEIVAIAAGLVGLIASIASAWTGARKSTLRFKVGSIELEIGKDGLSPKDIAKVLDSSVAPPAAEDD